MLFRSTTQDQLDGIAIDAAGLNIPGLPTLDEEFRAMFPFASRMLEADPYLDNLCESMDCVEYS